MKILQLSKKFPYPPKDGEIIAINHLSKALRASGCELTLLAMNTSKHPFSIKDLPSDFEHYKAIYSVDIDNRVKALDAFFNLFSSRSYHIERFVSKNYETQLIEILKTEKFDLVQLETLYLAPYIPIIRRYSDAKIALRSHNVEHEIWKRIAKNTAFGPKKWYLQLLTRRLERFEQEQLNTADILVAITGKDLDFFKTMGLNISHCVAPIGLNLKEYPASIIDSQKKPKLSFIGALDWIPNVEGLQWLLQEVWPLVLDKEPDAQFHIAGRHSPAWLLQNKQKGIKIHGEVASATAFMGEYEILLVPLLSGSGMRVKILEGMAMGRLVISTSVGIEGIFAQDGKEVFVADTPLDFANKIIEALRRASQVAEMGVAAHNFISTHFDNMSIAQNLLLKYKDLLMRP